ncbi:NAD(P)/FAD-dependent oxidoreductase [Tateyamaria sp. syn59]|uniref:flavin monoamine oxidase family protein n=1 Tax=Tateyamaria sp. syn59 TaxID=2576942 RepID=UPI0016774D6A|nr:NAD(P)/FAD-dependent oxidoreductase [Tateyamaria sp. syn59]
MTRALVLGAGLAGLVAALRLHQVGHDVTVLEARDRVGGRALTLPVAQGGIDLGPAWIWPAYQPNIMALLNEMDMSTLPQDETGDFVLETEGNLQRGAFPKRYTDAARIRSGVQTLAQRVAAALPQGTIHLTQEVHTLDLRGRPQVTTQSGTWKADVVICAVPGPIAAAWKVTPAWPTPVAQGLVRWPTWMAAHAKVVVQYDDPFWRDAGLSGGAISHRGPLFEIADQSDTEAGVFALFGFVSLPFDARQDQAELTRRSLAQLKRLFGPKAAQPRRTAVMDWAAERLTATPADRTQPHGHPNYGALSATGSVGGRLFFAGAEVSATHGGLIEGAIETGEHAAAMAARALVS